jgi:hypothetical protein
MVGLVTSLWIYISRVKEVAASLKQLRCMGNKKCKLLLLLLLFGRAKRKAKDPILKVFVYYWFILYKKRESLVWAWPFFFLYKKNKK